MAARYAHSLYFHDKVIFFTDLPCEQSPITWILSQHHKVRIEDVRDGKPHTIYNCAEQFYQVEKMQVVMKHGSGKRRDPPPRHPNVAAEDTIFRIMAEDDPRTQAELGNDIEMTGTALDEWSAKEYKMLVEINTMKFSQNMDERCWLFGVSGEQRFVYANPQDRVLGIGFGVDRALSVREHWGQNKLGNALNEATKVLIARYENDVMCFFEWDFPHDRMPRRLPFIQRFTTRLIMLRLGYVHGPDLDPNSGHIRAEPYPLSTYTQNEPHRTQSVIRFKIDRREVTYDPSVEVIDRLVDSVGRVLEVYHKKKKNRVH